MRRESILGIIRDKPGIGFNEIARQSNLSNGVVSHYILQLLKDKEVIKTGIRAKYFLHGFPEKDKELIIILLNATNFKIIKLLLEKNKPLKAKDISKIIGKSMSTVSVNLKKMEKIKIIEREILNEDYKLTSDIGFKISKTKIMKEIISKYNLN